MTIKPIKVTPKLPNFGQGDKELNDARQQLQIEIQERIEKRRDLEQEYRKIDADMLEKQKYNYESELEKIQNFNCNIEVDTQKIQTSESTCTQCNKKYKSQQQLTNHWNSKKHLERVKVLQLMELEEQDPQICEKQKTKQSHQQNLESQNFCLFCNKEYISLEECLNHMKGQHSFIILNSEELIDPIGLLKHIGSKILVKCQCIYCNKVFNDYQRCQSHMGDKGHSMINMDRMCELKAFYVPTNSLIELTKEVSVKTKINKIQQQDQQPAVDNVSSSSSFQIVDYSDQASTNSFSIVDKPFTDASEDSFSIVDYSDAEFDVETEYSIDMELEASKNVFQKKAPLNLHHVIKTARSIENGEYLLADGKIVSHKQYQQMCKQKTEMFNKHCESIMYSKVIKIDPNNSSQYAHSESHSTKLTRAQKKEQKKIFAQNLEQLKKENIKQVKLGTCNNKLNGRIRDQNGQFFQ